MIAEAAPLSPTPRVSLVSCAAATAGLVFITLLICTRTDTQSWVPGAITFVSVVFGGLGVLLGLLQLQHMSTWKKFVLAVWGIVGVTSPFWGWLILMPWGLMLLTAPLMFWILYPYR
jgi:uncharacterized membrane protein YsdA (DUF1294 family)